MSPAPSREARIKGRLPPQLVRCPGCGLHLYPQAGVCPHCKGDLAVLGRKQLKAINQARKALARISSLLDK